MIAGFFKTVFRVGIITAACGLAAVLVAGQDRVQVLLGKAHSAVVDSIDARIDDPTALRSQLRELEREYPSRIAQVRGDLAELGQQVTQLEREQAISERVVTLADQDLTVLRPLLDEARAAQLEKASHLSNGVRSVVSVRFDDRTLSLDQADRRALQIGQTRVAYANRAADASHDLVYLRQQSEHLDDLLVQLETERNQFQGQLRQLDRQVDAIARNEKLIDMLEKRKRTIEECSRYEVVSLDQVVARLDEVKARQQAELDLLTTDAQQVGYEDIARLQLSGEDALASHVGADSTHDGLVFTDGSPVRR